MNSNFLNSVHSAVLSVSVVYFSAENWIAYRILKAREFPEVPKRKFEPQMDTDEHKSKERRENFPDFAFPFIQKAKISSEIFTRGGARSSLTPATICNHFGIKSLQRSILELRTLNYYRKISSSNSLCRSGCGMLSVMAQEPVIYDTKSVSMEMEPGTFWWCSCGRSVHQPFCDGAHKGSGLKPLKVDLPEKKVIHWCLCKHTAHPPFCDGSHKKLRNPAS